MVKVLAILVSLFVLSTSYLYFNYQKSDSDFYILTYSSFISGPGKILSLEFEKDCNCSVQFINASEGEMIPRILEINKNVDLVIGLNEISFSSVKNLKWKKVNVKDSFVPPVSLKKENLVPYNWSPMGFVYRKSDLKNPPKSWKELLNSKDLKISLQDPRLSTPGLFFLYWVFSQQNIEPSYIYKKLKPLVHSYSPSWSSSYNLFQQGTTNLVFTYLSSLIYHWEDQKNKDYQFLTFKDHPYHVEYAAVPHFCKKCGLSKKFIKLMLSEKGQEILVKTNYMFPVNLDSYKKFKKFPKVQFLKEKYLLSFLKEKRRAIDVWKSYL